MPYRYRKLILSNSLTYVLVALATTSSASAADLFRWQDDQGNTHYTDQVPPEYIEQGYRVISEQGLTIRTIRSTSDIENSQAPSAPQIPKKQALEDRRCLITDSNEDGIIATRDRKLADTQAMLNLIQETISLLETQFRQLAKEAGDFEKQAKSIPESLLTQISATKKKIEKHQVRLKKAADNMTNIEQEFDKTRQHYRQLKSAIK